ncbi:Sodium/glucose cotransporter [Symmachiella dynata]|uniref:sodium:solute symporter n=1 Tax=Symmachiella dynata TaxID=2527995 RepID=UPI00118BBF63|nr:sodium:solute symporter [Symmachiella dynata]QDT51873.1 Sodium/glucose cotransporter [Symmachiella dynata]
MTATPLRTLDVVAILAYLLAMAGMGLYFARRNTTTAEYFVGNRSFRGWVIGLSMVGTTISSVTFLAFPADAFSADWRNLVQNLTLPFVAVIAVIYFVPLLRRDDMISAFQYLEMRFGAIARLYGVSSFLIIQLIRLARILFLVSLPVALLTGAPLWSVILCTGIFIAFYTIAGGIEAVIWTDVVQTIVLLLAGMMSIGYVVWQLPGGFAEVVAVGRADHKFDMGIDGPAPESTPEPNAVTDTQQDLRARISEVLSRKTLTIVILLGILEWLTTYCCDQTVVQRYAAAKSMREARKATMLFSVMALPTWILFFFVGTCLYAFYQAFPDPQVVELQQSQVDAVFPHFILTQIPAGLGGLVIAGVLAAAMSSLDSSINSIATVTVVDILKPFVRPGRSDKYYLVAARIIALFAAMVMIGGAIALIEIPFKNINTLTWIVSSVFGGCLVGLFMLGFFTTRVDYRCVVAALIPGILLNVYLALNISGQLPGFLQMDIHEYWVGIIVNVVFVTVALGISLFPRTSMKDLRGLTVWTRAKTD